MKYAVPLFTKPSRYLPLFMLRKHPFKKRVVGIRVIPRVMTDTVAYLHPYLNTETDPAPAYTFATVEGNVSGDKLSLNARMSEELAPYIAGKEFVFVGVETIE